jgi:hypothetical protein
MADIPLDKRTISVGIIMAAFPIVFYGITTWTRVQAQTDRNTSDIASIVSKLDSVNENLVKTNGNIIELNTKLEGLTRESTTRVEVSPRSTTSVVYIQPARSQTGLGASSSQGSTLQPQERPQNQTPEQTQGDDAVFADAIRLVGTVTEIAGIKL